MKMKLGMDIVHGSISRVGVNNNCHNVYIIYTTESFIPPSPHTHTHKENCSSLQHTSCVSFTLNFPIHFTRSQ